jgi:alpha/beta superfamily hydrolase
LPDRADLDDYSTLFRQAHFSAGAEHTKTERAFIPGPAGRLEALLEWNPAVDPNLAALVCHPHPQFGGTMHNKVVFHAAKAALQLGIPTLRFNYRGVGKSQGVFGHGIGERADVEAVLDYVERHFPGRPICVIGFSFGALVGLAVGSTDPRTAMLVGLGVPILSGDFSFLRQCSKPKLIVQGTADAHGPRERVAALFAGIPEPKRIHLVEGADHFFTGRLREVQAAVGGFIKDFMSDA